LQPQLQFSGSSSLPRTGPACLSRSACLGRPAWAGRSRCSA